MVSFAIRDWQTKADPILMNPKSLLGVFLEFWSTRERDISALPEEEQTKLSWARQATSCTEVPEIYRRFFDSLPAEKIEPFPYTVITPTYKGFLAPENEKLICRIDRNIHVLEKTDGRLVSICYPLDGIYRMETGTILLNSWLTINGIDPNGKPSATTLRFNSASGPLLAGFIDGFRGAVAGPADGAEPDLSAFDTLEARDFKFMNYGRKTVRVGEQVIQAVVQPELRKTFVPLSGLTLSRRITPAHMTILTDCELILIRDEDSRRRRKERPYGRIWNYIPLKKITNVTLIPTEDGDVILSVQLPRRVRMDSMYQASLRHEAVKLQQRIKAEMAG
jgi:hypothetical protein